MGYLFELLGEQSVIEPVYQEEGIGLRVDGKITDLDFKDLGGGDFIFEVDGDIYPVRIATSGDSVFIHSEGESYEILAINSLEKVVEEARGVSSSDSLIAPMPGVVIRVEKNAGDPVKRGETILVIESMKLQTAVTSFRDGFVSSILVKEGGGFEKGSVLAVLTSDEIEEDQL